MLPAYPGGWPGLGLVVLRLAVALPTLAQGTALVARGPSTSLRGVGAVIVVGGTLLLLGLVTPAAATVSALSSAATALAWLPRVTALDGRLSSLLMCGVAVALVLLGPGAKSLDSRLFGRREIIIPPRDRERGP
jgi:uncharacterized membrane protein YphA (DoxX/SURF4 family)